MRREREEAGSAYAQKAFLLTDLETGKPTIIRRRRRKPSLPAREMPGAVSKWWHEAAMEPFLSGALVWREELADAMAEDAGANIETGSVRMNIAQTEGDLRDAYKRAQSMGINAPQVVHRLKNEARIIEDKTGTTATWIGNYLLWNVTLISEAYRLNEKTAKSLRDFAALQKFLPNF